MYTGIGQQMVKVYHYGDTFKTDSIKAEAVLDE